MTTDLKKSVKRKTLRSIFGFENGKKLIVMLETGDIVAIREERGRTWRRISVHTLYQYLCRRDAEELRKSKRSRR